MDQCGAAALGMPLRGACPRCGNPHPEWFSRYDDRCDECIEKETL